ncbi:uncharacterized protein hwt [Anabrus simplex]|uniref:uncharacterized protein hwt n=1 Tax=Anabrus simplex TaxID=316456 RepID=UPI0035A3323B
MVVGLEETAGIRLLSNDPQTNMVQLGDHPVSLCDEYSLPVDFVNKRRPHSFGAGLANWTTPSPSGDQVEVVEAYSDPRDSKAYLEPGEEASGKLYTSPDRDYSQPYTDGSSETKTADDQDDGVYEDVGQPDEQSLAEACNECVTVIDVDVEQELEDIVRDQAPQVVPPRRNPSPYYYSDLFRDSEGELNRRPSVSGSRYRKCVSLDAPPPPSEVVLLPKRNSVAGDGSDSLVAVERATQHVDEWDAILMPPHRQLRPSVCACAGVAQCVRVEDEIDDEESRRNRHLHFRSTRDIRLNGQQPPLEEPPVDYDDPDVEEGLDEYCDDMSGRQRHVYETAFDCKVSRSDDDLDDVDRVTNHPILQMFGSNKVTSSNAVKTVKPSSSKDAGSLGIFTPKERRKITLVRGKLVKDRPKALPSRVNCGDNMSSTTTLSQDLEGLVLEAPEVIKAAPSPSLPLRGYSPSPPSTAPLPAKFHGNKDLHNMNSIRSAPNLPAGSPAHARLKDMRLPVKSLRARESCSKGSIMEFKGRPMSLSHDEENVQEFKGRPHSMFQEGAHILEFKDRLRVGEPEHGLILEFKGRPASAVAEFSVRDRGTVGQESGPILEFKGRPGVRRCGVRPKYSSSESMATSSSGGSLESIRSSTSEGNRSTTSSESHRSSSLSSHSSDSTGSCGSSGSTTGNLHHLHHLHHYYHHHQCSAGTPLGVVSGSRFFAHQSNKLHILSPISDKSSQEPASETSDNNRNNNSQKASPEDTTEQITSPASTTTKLPLEQPWSEQQSTKVKRRAPQNKNLINLSLQQQSSGETEIQGSDSGISIESRGGCKGYCGTGDPVEPPPPDFSDLPFDMPKLRRRRLLQQDTCTSGSATSVDLHELPFDMPKLRRRLRGQQEAQTSTESSGVSQASSSQSVQDTDRPSLLSAPGRPSLSLNLDGGSGGGASPKKRLGLCLNLGGGTSAVGDNVDVNVPLERQGWYHGAITRLEAENVLRLHQEGSYLVRNSESTRQDYSLSLKSARGFMHMRIQQNKETGKFILGQFSKPFDNIPQMIHHYTVNRLPIRGAEHMCLLQPVIEQLL